LKKILIVEDDADIRELIRYNLAREGFDISLASTGLEGFQAASTTAYDLIILDLMLPELSGIEVCKKLREKPETKHTPIIMLTAKGEEADIVYGLGVGADDYMTKPFGLKELIARVYTRIKSQKFDEQPSIKETHSSDFVRQGPVEIDRARFQVKVGGEQIIMTLAEFRLFNALISKPGIVLSRDRLLDAVAGGESVLIDRNIDVHVRSIRKKLGEYRDLIETVRGLGYRFKEI
jgi:DNA-binding response OmpR family regulator